MATITKPNGVPVNHDPSTIKLPPTWDHWLGQILPVAVPEAEQYIENLVKQEIAKVLENHPGKSFWEVFGEAIAAKLKDQTLRQDIFDKLHLTGFIAKVSNFSHGLLNLVKTDPNLASIRDAAQRLDTKKIAAELADGASTTARVVRRELFNAEPTATIAGIVQEDKVVIPNDDPVVKEHTLTVLSRMGSADLSTNSPHTVLRQQPKLLAKIPSEHRVAVVENINTLARTQTVARSPPALEAMMNNGLTSAVSIAKAPMMELKSIMSHDDAVFAKSTANKVILQNQMLLASLVDRVKTQTPGLVGPSDDRDARRLRIKDAFRNRGLNPNLEDLFDSADQTDADENTTVYSPASYFVDLLMYLRSNNLDGKISPDVSRSGEDDSYRGTALEVFFRRRPDLQDLELTPANTSALLPYIDLVNEVMESFVTHLPEYIAHPSGQSPIDSFNVATQNSDDLLSQPQNVRMDAYRHLAGAVYPPTLPYHQPVDAQRAFLSFLGTSRAEVLNAFRPKPSLQKFEALASKTTNAQLRSSETLVANRRALNSAQARALDAQYYCEILGLVQEEFLVLTKGVFWEKEFFEISAGLSPMTNDQYQRRVGLRSTLQCWGYSTAEEMISTDANARTGLSFVKEQLLPRSGLSYKELINIISTSFVNPYKPTGVDRIVFDSLRYSYKFLQELVDNTGSARYDRMADFVASHVSELNLQALLERSELQSTALTSPEAAVKESLRTWIKQNFKRIGRTVVIDAGEGPRLKVTGRIVAVNRTATGLPTSILGMAEVTSDGRIVQVPSTELSQAPVATLLDDGTILDFNGNRMGQVGLNARVYYLNPLNDNDFNSVYPKLDFFIENQPLWVITGGKLTNSSASDNRMSSNNPQSFNEVWELEEGMGGSGSIEDARLVHLDGSPLPLETWDRLHRFIRLWGKLGWSTAETDRAVSSLLRTGPPSSHSEPDAQQTAHTDGTTWDKDSKPFDYQLPVNFEDFEDDSLSSSSQDPDSSIPLPDITFEMIEQLAAIKQIMSKTHLTLEELLTFFSCMTSEGPKSQYVRLFLTRQRRTQSPVFAADASGSYFASVQTVSIRQHISTVAAALSMRQEDITFITTPQNVFPKGTVDDLLNMNNITRLYRYALLARTLSVKVKDLFQIMAGFGDPFSNPKAFLGILNNWETMAKAGFPWPELRYVVDQIPAWSDPLALTAYESLRVAASLRTKIIEVQTAYPLDLPVSKRTPDYTSTIASLLLPASTVTIIMGLLLGTSTNSVPAPVVPISNFSNLVSACSQNVAAYIVPPTKDDLKPKAILKITGIISNDIKNDLKQLLHNPTTDNENRTLSPLQKAWEISVDQVCEKPFSSFKRVMNGILPNGVIENELSGEERVLLAPDPLQATLAIDAPSQIIGNTTVSATAAKPNLQERTTSNPKIDKFLAHYIPFLQDKLSYNSVLDTLATAAGFSDTNIAKTYLENVISVSANSKHSVTEKENAVVPADSHQSAIDYIIKFLRDSLTIWVGNLNFDVTGDYIFSIQNTWNVPSSFHLKPITKAAGEDDISAAYGSSGLFGVSAPHNDDPGPLVHFKRSLGGLPGMWVTDKVTIAAGYQYLLTINTAEKSKLRWQTASMEARDIPQDRYVPLWKGYLRPTTTDVYQFYAKDLGLPVGQDRPIGTVVFDGRSRDWDHPVDSDSDTFYPLKNKQSEQRLDASKLHSLTLTGIFPNQLCWKTPTTDIESIPSTCFLPASTPNQIYSILTKLQKLALFSNHFKLSSEEILYIHQNSRTFTKLPEDEAKAEAFLFSDVPAEGLSAIDLDGIHALRGCTRLYDYIQLRDQLPQNTTWSLIQLFSWATQNTQVSGTELAQKISLATSWPVDEVLVLLKNSNFTTGVASEFCNERLLIRLQAQLDLSRRMCVPPETLFIWASPLGTAPRDFYAYHAVSQAIQQSAAAKFAPTDWTIAVRPVNNLLRENQRAALVDYLLVQQKFVRDNNIVDADGLFEFFLIDVQMKPLVETSRIVQAIATIQLFVQRCMLGLEENFVITQALDRQRWEWMQNYRVWQANRQIFLYPENWIVPSLRDDKSEIFKKFESELLQTNLSKHAVGTALRNYVCNLADLTDLKAVGLHVEKGGKGDVHIFAHTRTSPFIFYYNRYRLVQGQLGQWDGWQDMKVQLPAVLDPLTNISGIYMAPVVFDGRLIVFVPEITQQTVPRPFENELISKLGDKSVKESVPQKVWELKMSWTEYRNGSWTPRQTCPQPYRDSIEHDDVSQYVLIPCLLWNGGQSTTSSGQEIPPNSVAIYVANFTDQDELAKHNIKPSILAGWIFDGRQVSLMTQGRMQNFNWMGYPFSQLTFQVIQPDTKSSDATNAPPAGATTPAPTKSAALFSLQASNITSAPSASPEKNVRMDGVHHFIEDADSYSSFLATKALGATVVDDQGPSIVSPSVLTGADSSTLKAAAQRFYHGFIHDLMRVTTNGSDITFLFDILEKVGKNASPQATDQDIKDFGEAFGAITSTGNTILSVPAPATMNGTAVPIIDLDTPPMFDSSKVTAGSRVATQFDQRSRLYSLYNWELGMHACMALMDSLLKAQQYEQARSVAHYVFDPFAAGDKSDPSRFWKFPPFKVASVATIESLFLELEAGAVNNSISDWRDHPFQPHVVARSRPEAYMKWIVINYIKILVGWGDSLFSQNTLETIPQAIQLYVMASHIYGPRGQIIPQRTNPVPQTFRTLSKKFDAFSNAMVQLEEAFPFSNQTALPVGKLPLDEDDYLPNVFGSAGALYFAIPDNPSVRQLASTIDDRLFKIRNSEDINGKLRVLPLLAPPIDPAMLVQAQAQGLSLSSVLQDLQGPLPNCRFEVLLQKAFEVVAEAKALGNSLISIRERHDAEELLLVRQRQQSSLQKSLMDIKKMSLQDAQSTMNVLQYNRAAAVSRLSYWFKLVGNDMSGIPALDQEFQELDAKIAAPITSGGLALSAHEQEYLEKSSNAQDITANVNSIEIALAAMRVIPDVSINTQPLGLGQTTSIGSGVLSSQYDAIAKGFSRTAHLLQSQASTSSTIGGHQRALQERILQANTAGYEISNIDKQITGAQVRIALAEREIEIQQQEINDAQQITDYLTSKYSSVDLYTYLDGATKSLSYQTYNTALALAKRVEKAFRYERPQDASTSYIQAGYWDSTKDGLFAGENLYLSLKQLEASYLDSRGHDYEIVKSISLRSLNPLSLIRLREKGTCDFSLDEMLFDMDFPGHYLRRLKSVSLTIPP
ncbi:hypothetical protein OPT61_g8277 [Boeremia exigua]|uniref:Uncharacterized protein n=1 Tax=Boeremia exigua TaxID=749465 RepID=A0ACC2HYW7_9PLEO|nr:hypothetical protein OPT61_g8277 [Boeremia exigua]